MMPRMTRLTAGLSLVLAMFAAHHRAWAGADEWMKPPQVPAALAVPPTATVAAHFRGVGAQVYACVAVPGPTAYTWTLQKPDAKLFDRKGAAAGTHGAGPSWTANDGSSVTGKKVADAPAPSADAIPWLLIRGEKSAGHGVFSEVTFVQRVGTAHGKAPATGCEAATKGAEKRVDYSADYYFYKGGAGVSEAPFGRLDDGRNVTLYTVTNSAGVEARIINYGAILVSLKVPDRQGALRDVVLGYDDLAGYVKDKSFLGATVGRYANRIAGGKLTLDGKTYQLDRNNGPNHLHGGAEGFYKKLWQAEVVKGKDGPGVRLTYVSPDGEGGYPGRVTLTVTYTVTGDNALRIDYHGTTDKPTVLNPTHHSYFNLGGDPTKTILDELLTIDADKATPVGPDMVPTGQVAAVAGTPLDFRQPTRIGARIDAKDQQLELAKGYDHNWVLRDPGKGVRRAAELQDPRSGIVMDVLTDQPGLQFYSGNFLDGSIHGKHGVVYQRHAALCLEAQLFPDAPNHPSFPSATIRPGQPYTQTTVYRFSVK
jgi:aldose 1-epimerase